MAQVLYENAFLKETPLTSTKNKFLFEPESRNIFYDEFTINRKRKLHSSYLESLTTENALTSTVNKFLPKPPLLEKKRVCLKKKKKKKFERIGKSQRYRARRSRSRSAPSKSSESDTLDALRGYSFAKKCFRRSAPASGPSYCPTSPSYCEEASEYISYRDADFPESERIIPPEPSEAISNPLGFEHSEAISNPLVFEQSEAISNKVDFGASGANFGFCFGAPAAFSGPDVAGNRSDAFLLGAAPALHAPLRLRQRAGGIPRSAVLRAPFLAPDLFKMPTYNFQSAEVFKAETFESFSFVNAQASLLQLEKAHCIKSKKMQFLNITSMALIYNSNLKNAEDVYRVTIQKYADEVKAFDPEFILKVALFGRQELHIRSASNFLLSYAAYHEETRPYLEKYFESCIRLPSDWMEVADLYQVFSDPRLNNRSLPSALKKVMAKSFSKFDEYQLAKYNREKKASVTKGFTLKQLIRLLHLDSPANEIMCLLGKKYPESAEAFRKSKLPGIWDSRKAGQRMKLPIPETWETQIPAHGNKPEIWEQLLDHSKLPYMAMLRNLRNLILSGMSQKHHEKVLKHLKSKGAVINSRQSPLQFFEAFKVLDDIRDAYYVRKVYINSRIGEPQWKKARRSKMIDRADAISMELVSNYEEAVSDALEISALHNLQPIPGKSLVICDILFPSSLETSKKIKMYNLCIMMGLMCLKACEDCKMNVICGNYSDNFELHEGYSFCESIKNACSQYQNKNENTTSDNSGNAVKSILEYYLKQHVILREKLDHVIVLRASGSDGGAEVKGVIKSFLHKYREVVNPELLYTDVDFLMSNSSLADSDSADGKDVYLGGNATQLVKFIAERSSGGQLTYVENIDLKYELQTKKISKKCKKPNALPEQEKLPVLTKVPKWHTVRIFISSTFKDMHSERDLLIRYVIPELRKRAATVFVKINEVDLRWGITETDCASKRAAELCLLEAQKSDLFIGMLGERYGTIFNYDPPDSPELQWVKDYPSGLSITELEMHAGALRSEKLLKKRAFFYIRNSMSLIPEKYKSHFESEDPESKQKVEALKSKIRSSGLKFYDEYPCHFAGVLEGKPVLSGLDNFGKTVLNDTWNAIKEMHEQDPYADDVMEEEMCQQALLHNFDSFVEVKNSPVENLVKEIEKQSGIFLISGNSGSGKTTFVVDLLTKLKNFSVIKFFVGLSPRSTELSYMLQYISISIARTFPVSSVFPKLTSDVMNHFPDILQEAVNSSGNADFVLVIDGLDHLSADDQLLDWLPVNLPQGLRLICSASDTSYAFKVLNERHAHGAVVHVNLPGINQSDRENIIRQYLRLYGKSLDESSFNNQMLLLVTKKDSGIPLYLRIACDYLRSYASFDKFMSTLQGLPPSMPLLFQEIILQMENEYGSILVQTMLTLLCVTKEGLDDADLHTLLTLVSLEKEKRSFLSFNEAIQQLKKLGPDNMLSQVTYCSLMHTVSSFAFGHRRFKKFSLIGSEFEKAVKKFYLNKNYSNFSKYMHRILAAYYFIICDSEDNGSWKGRSGSAFRGLIFHLFYGNCFQELADYLCCLQFLETAFSVEASDLLLEYYSLLFEERRAGSSEALRKIDFPLLSSFYNFVARNLHIFQSYPDLVLQQALNEPSDSLVKLNLQKEDIYKSPVVECLSVSDNDPRIATLGGFFKNITSASCQKVASHAFLGSEDGYLKVLDFPSKRIIRSVKSHSSAITFICSAGKDRICTASTDTTLSIWSTIDYSRISVLKGHKHIVSCCCADATSTILLSSGWDNSVRLWSLRDGSSISVIDFGCPVNCIDNHPTKQQVACGLWSGNVEIWDTVSLKKELTLSSICSSVKSIVYTLDGLNLITSYMNSDVTIWSSEQGLKISCLKGHVLPVKSISYSLEGDKIISGSDDCTLKIWPSESGLSVRTFSECKFFPISVLEIISPNHLAVGYQNSDIWVMDMDTGFVTTKLSLEADLVSCFSRFDPLTYASRNTEENWVDLSVVFGTKSGNVMVGNFRTSEIMSVGSINARITAIIHNVRFIVCGSSEGDIGLFSYPGMNSKIVSGAHGGSVTAVNLFTRDEKVWVITAGSDKVIKLWEIDHEELVMKEEFFSKHYDYVTCCSSYHDCVDRQSFLTGSHDNNVISQNEYSDKTVFEGLKTSVVYVAGTDKYVLGCGSDGSVAMWSEEGTLLSYISGIEQSSVVLSYRVDKDISGEFDVTLAFVDRDGSVKIRKPNQRAFSYSLEGHNRSITSCCTSQNGEILSCSLDGTVNLWKIPEQNEDFNPEHLASITDICLSLAQNEVVSSDAYGNVVIWRLTLSADVPLMYAGKKTYTGGFVKALSLLRDRKLVCAVTQAADDGDKHFVDVLYCDCNASDDNSIYNFQVKKSHDLDSEVLCLDASLKTETVVVGLKSGNFVIIASDVKKTFNISDDWVLGVKLSSHSIDSAEFIFTSLLNGTVKRIKTEEALKNDTVRALMEEIQCPDLGNIPVFISAFCCASFDSVYCGDSQGWLRRYSNAPISKKIHDDSVTGIAVCGRYVFTCSLDKTLKGWNSALNQVCLFHSSVPITCLVGCEMVLTSSIPTYVLVIGTSSGAVQLLKFHDKQNN